MSIPPKDFFTHSRKLANKSEDKEIARRSSISKGYYYAFHYVRENGKTHPITSHFRHGGGDHGEAVDFLDRMGEKKLSRELSDLQEWRENADYELGDPIGKNALDDFHGALKQFRDKVKNKL